MTDRPFRRGSLRTVLLDQAETVLRERGMDALSLRELAREAGVSHGAPRSHFIDRQALLDALAERGLTRLAEEIERAAAQASAGPEGHADALHAAGRAYLRFAERQPALLGLMYAAKVDAPAEDVQAAAERLFGILTEIMDRGVEAGAYGAEDVGRLTLLLSATVQGISALAACRRITAPQSETLLEDAIALFTTGRPAACRPAPPEALPR